MFDAHDTVVVIGVGRTGLAVAEVLRARGIAVISYDDKPRASLGDAVDRLDALGVTLGGPADRARIVAAATAAVISPGVPPESAIVVALDQAGVPIHAEIEVAFRLARAPIIAVTGSKGKSTTTALIGQMLRAAGTEAHVGGNIGDPLIRKAVSAGPAAWLVAEVSSFQLERTSEFAPRISVLLNITADHLDRYRSMDDYAHAKYRIFAHQGDGDSCVVNADDPRCRTVRGALAAKSIASRWFSTGGDPSATMVFDGDSIRLTESDGDDAIVAARAELTLRGAHNVANAMAATLAALQADVPLDAIRDTLRSFAPLAHRFASVAAVDGVEWIDDSKATNPDAAIKALEALAGPTVLIAGGRSKNTDFTRLGAVAAERASAVVLIGEAAREIGAHIAGPPVVYAGSMKEAVDAAARFAAPGGTVLLSPACASFDMFESAEQRGETFARLARGRASAVSAS